MFRFVSARAHRLRVSAYSIGRIAPFLCALALSTAADAQIFLRPSPSPAPPAAPINPSAAKMTQQAAQLMNQRKFDEALPLLDRAIALDPRLIVARRLRVVVHLQRNEMTPALADLNQLVKNSPKDTQLLVTRGTLLAATKQYDTALADFDRALALDAKKSAAIADTRMRRSLGQHGRAVVGIGFKHAQGSVRCERPGQCQDANRAARQAYSVRQFRARRRRRQPASRNAARIEPGEIPVRLRIAPEQLFWGESPVRVGNLRASAERHRSDRDCDRQNKRNSRNQLHEKPHAARVTPTVHEYIWRGSSHDIYPRIKRLTALFCRMPARVRRLWGEVIELIRQFGGAG